MTTESLMLSHVRHAARANRLANRRLHDAIGRLSRDEFLAPRTSFFPSLAQTLDHILAVDTYYLDALHGRADMVARYEAFVPAADIAALAARQRACDERLIAWCDALDEDRLREPVAIDRGERIDRDAVHRVLAHLAMHQTHHRGQAHAMLSDTAVKPPQLDDFLLASDAPVRVDDLRALGWCESDLLAEGPRQVP